MTLEVKNRVRFRVRMFGIGQWAVVLGIGVAGWVVGKPLTDYAMLLTASTTGMTTMLGLDYFTKPTQ